MTKATNRKFKKIAATVLTVIMMLTMAVGMTASAAGSVTSVQAKQIALNHAGLTEAQVTGLTAVTDYDDGVLHYEVEFYCDGVEYDYDIKASDGSIMSFEKDGKDGGNGQTDTGDTFIGKEAALAKALKHAGLKKSDVTVRQNKLDYDDGRYEYQIEFVSNGVEYEYEVDATTGAVRSVDLDNAGIMQMGIFSGVISFISLKIEQVRALFARLFGF